jgi:hypothetical protein
MEKKVERINGNQLLLSSIVGKTTKEGKDLANFNGYLFRVIREDDEQFFVTMELRGDRIQVEIDNGIITKASIS